MSTSSQRTVPEFISLRRNSLGNLCRRHAVVRLELIGSATGSEFDYQSSDLDFLVEFDHSAQIESWLGNYVGFQDAFERLFGRLVDLVSLRRVENPYVRASIEEQRVVLNAA